MSGTFLLVIFLFLGVAAASAFPWLGRYSLAAERIGIALILFTMGAGLFADEEVCAGIAALGGSAAVVAAGAVAGSVLLAALVSRFIIRGWKR